MERGCGPRALLVGLLSIVLSAGWLAFTVWQGQAAAATVRGLQPGTAATVRAAAPGQRVLLEGQLSGNETRQSSLVAYVHSSRLDGADARLQVYDTIAPPLTLTVADGDVRIEAGYALINPDASYALNNRRGSVYSGFANGSQVMAVGRVVGGPTGNTVRADFLYGGTRSQFLWSRLGEAGAAVVGGGCGVVVGLLLVVGGLLSWRAGRQA